MRGFADGPRYRNFVTQSLANASVASERAEYHQLTTALPGGLQPVSKKNRMRAAQPSFYAQGNTDLSTALDSLDPDGLTVLVTDLFQSNADMNAVSQAIVSRTFDEGLAVGLVASRFSFDGRIYDIGPSGGSFDFEGKRPLHSLIFGPPKAVSTYFENLQKFVDPSKYKFLLFSSRIVERSGQVRFSKSSKVENLVRVIPNAKTRLPSTQTLGLRIRDNGSSARLDSQFHTDVLPGVRPLLGTKSIKTRVTEVWKLDTKSNSYDTGFQGAAQATEALRTQVVRNDSARLQLQIRPKNLSRGFYAFNIVAEVQQWQLPTWVSEWNLPPSDFQTPDGSKTANLRPFLQNIGSSLTGASAPRTAVLQAYVEKQ